MRIGFIGAGKVATAFGRYLHGHGLLISGYYDRHAEKISHAASQTRSRQFTNAFETTRHSDIVLITTRDDQIAGVCQDLCSQGGVGREHMVGHMSGAHSSRILSQADRLGATVFSLHPLQAFADEDKALAELPKSYFSLEGDEQRLEPVKEILSRIGNPYFCISPEHKSLYHLSACMLSNYLVTLMDSGLAALERSGIERDNGFKAMRPLIEGTLSNIARMGTAQALTGPIARGDAGTVDEHLRALDQPGLEDIESVYRHMGLYTLKLAERHVLQSPQKAASVREKLQQK